MPSPEQLYRMATAARLQNGQTFSSVPYDQRTQQLEALMSFMNAYTMPRYNPGQQAGPTPAPAIAPAPAPTQAPASGAPGAPNVLPMGVPAGPYPAPAGPPPSTGQPIVPPTSPIWNTLPTNYSGPMTTGAANTPSQGGGVDTNALMQLAGLYGASMFEQGDPRQTLGLFGAQANANLALQKAVKDLVGGLSMPGQSPQGAGQVGTVPGGGGGGGGAGGTGAQLTPSLLAQQRPFR